MALIKYLEEAAGSCSRHVLARSPVGSVERCACGAVHLAIGAVSLRLEPVVFLALAVMVREGVVALERENVTRRVAAS